MFEAFFAASNCIASCPIIRSNSAIRSCSSPRLGLVAKISDARSTNSPRQRENTSGFNRCFRQISALLFMPVSSSRTTCALKSGVNVLRFVIVLSPFLDSFYSNYRSCPILGGHYTLFAFTPVIFDLGLRPSWIGFGSNPRWSWLLNRRHLPPTARARDTRTSIGSKRLLSKKRAGFC